MKRFFLVFILFGVQLSLAQTDAPKTFTVLGPPGYPHFNEHPVFIRLQDIFTAYHVGLVLADFPGPRGLLALEQGEIDITLGRKSDSLLAASTHLIRIEEPLDDLRVYLYLLKENYSDNLISYCDGAWAISTEQKGVEQKIAEFLGCETIPPIIWKNHIQERVKMLEAKRFLLMPAPSIFEPIIFGIDAEVVRVEPAFIIGKNYLFIHSKYKALIPAITESLRRFNQVKEVQE